MKKTVIFCTAVLLAIGLSLALPPFANAEGRGRGRDHERITASQTIPRVQTADWPRWARRSACPYAEGEHWSRNGRGAGQRDCPQGFVADCNGNRDRGCNRDGACDGTFDSTQQHDRKGPGGKGRGRK